MKKTIFVALFCALSLFAAEKEVTLKVSGMTCQMCAKTVKETLMKTDGVKEAKVYVTDGKSGRKNRKRYRRTGSKPKTKITRIHS